MWRLVVIVGACAVLVVALFAANSLMVDWNGTDREPSDGWCDLLPGGAPNADDPDCDDWSGVQPTQ